jgi:integrase
VSVRNCKAKTGYATGSERSATNRTRGPYGGFLSRCREQLAELNLHMHDLRREAGSRLLERGADLHTVQLFLDHANISTSSRYLKPSKLALHTTIRRIDAERRASGEAAKWEQERAETKKNLQEVPQHATNW